VPQTGIPTGKGKLYFLFALKHWTEAKSR